MAKIDIYTAKDETKSYVLTWYPPRHMNAQKRISTTFWEWDHAVLGKQIVEDAKAAILKADLERIVEERIKPKQGGLTVAEWADEFLQLKSGEIKVRTLKNYRTQLDEVILPALGRRPVDDLTGSEIKKFLDDIRETRKIRYATCDRYFALIKHMLRIAKDNGKIKHNPALVAGWKLGKAEPGANEDDYPERFFEVDEYNQLLAQFRPDYRLFVSFLCETGVRFSEATSLKFRDLDFENDSAWIRAVINDDGDAELPKSGKKRLIEVPPWIMAHLRVKAAKAKRTDLVFTSSKGMKINNPNFRRDHWNPAMIRLQQCPKHLPERIDGRNGLAVYDPHSPSDCDCLGDRIWTTFTPHALRHTFATWMLRKGRSITLVSKQLGHSSTKVTETVYAHLENWWRHDKEARLTNTLDEVLDRKATHLIAV